MKHQFHCTSAAGLQFIIRLKGSKQIKLHFWSRNDKCVWGVRQNVKKKTKKTKGVSICTLIPNFTLLLANVNMKSYMKLTVYTHKVEIQNVQPGPWTLDSFVQILGSALWQFSLCGRVFFFPFFCILLFPSISHRQQGDWRFQIASGCQHVSEWRLLVMSRYFPAYSEHRNGSKQPPPPNDPGSEKGELKQKKWLFEMNLKCA